LKIFVGLDSAISGV